MISTREEIRSGEPGLKGITRVLTFLRGSDRKRDDICDRPVVRTRFFTFVVLLLFYLIPYSIECADIPNGARWYKYYESEVYTLGNCSELQYLLYIDSEFISDLSNSIRLDLVRLGETVQTKIVSDIPFIRNVWHSRFRGRSFIYIETVRVLDEVGIRLETLVFEVKSCDDLVTIGWHIRDETDWIRGW